MLEKKMYFFVPYQLTGMQKGIQCGHAAEQYAHKYKDEFDYNDYAENWKTWVVLDGGTTNSNLGEPGSLNIIERSLRENLIPYMWFREPDLENALTAICFLCDERVFDRKLVPDFIDYVKEKEYKTQKYEIDIFLKKSFATLSSIFPISYKEWVTLIGGTKNAFLRELITGKKLA